MASVELAAILITDLVGSTELESRHGPARADELRREHFALLREAVEGCAGREIKNTGDGLMIAFPSSSAAISCAARMQQLMERRNRFADQQLHVRIGVGAGEATVDDGDYFGMPSIEAARLCDQAPGDGILVSAMARMMAGQREELSFESAGMLQLKGIAEPVEAFVVAWAPLGPAAIAGDSELPAPLRALCTLPYVGRLEEHERLRGRLREVSDGMRKAVFVSGEPGIGKTRLVGQVAMEAHGAGFTVCWGAAAEDVSAPYGLWIQALSHYAERAPEEVLARHIERHAGQLLPLLRTALARRAPDLSMPAQSDPETDRYLLFDAVVDLLEAACEQAPLVLVLEDLQWAGADTLALLRHVVKASGHIRLLLLGTCRESDLARGHPLATLLADLRAIEGVERVSLDGLDAGEVAQMMTVAVGHEMSGIERTLAPEIAQETDGNPFFVSEIARHLTESGAIARRPDGGWELRRSIAELGLPESVREVVARRVERLGAPVERTLTAASVVGRAFDVELLTLLLQGDEEELLDTLDQAVRASLVVESTERVGRFSFAHALIGRALYDAVGATRRARLHRRVAVALEELAGSSTGAHLVDDYLSETAGLAAGSAAMAAHHWREADEPERAVHALMLAAKQAASQWAQAEAVALYNQALGLIPEEDEARRRAVKLERAMAYARFTHMQDATS